MEKPSPGVRSASWVSSVDALGHDVNFDVRALTATTRCYLMAHVSTTPNLRKLDANGSGPEDTNNAKVVSKDTYRNVLKASVLHHNLLIVLSH